MFIGTWSVNGSKAMSNLDAWISPDYVRATSSSSYLDHMEFVVPWFLVLCIWVGTDTFFFRMLIINQFQFMYLDFKN